MTIAASSGGAPAAGRAFSDAYGTASSQANPNAWEDWDISSEVTAGATVAFIEITGLTSGAAASAAGVRKKGSSTDRSRAFCSDSVACIGQFRLMAVECGTDRIIERYSEGAVARWNFRVVGFM